MPAAPETLYLIDGHAQIFRAYHAIRGGMTSPVTGEPTQASFGMAGMFLKLLNTFRPSYVAMAIDMPGKTFRDEMYAEYKETRSPTPQDLLAQEPRIFDMTRKFGIPILGKSGAEADDIIATVTSRVINDPALSHLNIRIVSKDKDLEQLLSGRVTMFDIHTDTTIDAAWLQANKGITPAQVIDMLALMGDTVDNVPGVEGVGPKTASQFIQEFGSIDGIYANLDKIKGKRRENLEKAREKLPLSRKLVALKHDVEIDFDLSKAKAGTIDGQGLRNLFEQLGFRRHVNELDRLLGGTGEGESVDAETVSQVATTAAMASPATATAVPSVAAASASATASAPPGSLFAGDSHHDEPGGQGSLFASIGDDAPGGASTATGPTPGFASAADCDYGAITTQQQLDDLVATLRKQPIFAIDTETIGLGHAAEMCGISIAWREKHGVYIPLCSPQQESHLGKAAVLRTLGPLFEEPTVPKTGHNLKYDALVLRAAGVWLRGIVFDSMIGAFLVGTQAHGLDFLAQAVLKHEMIPISRLIGPNLPGKRGLARKTMDKVNLDLITQYAAEDADIALRLYHLLERDLKVLGMERLAREAEMPLVEVLAEMEYEGVRVDPAVLDEQAKDLNKRIIELRDAIHEKAGEPFNIDSQKQLGDILFRKLGLPVLKRTPQRAPSTDVEVLERLAELDNVDPKLTEVPRLLVEYRQLTKLVGTYLVNLKEAINPRTGRVHATFNQTGAETGRLSSNNPNLQNIPIRSEVGRQIRKAFIAAPGKLLISADYSQIELRILAHMSQDKALCEAFTNDLDIHTAVAAQVFSTPLEAVTREQRNYAKVINFGIIYGVTAYGLARRIEGLDVEAAKKLIADYRRRFSGIDAFLQKCIGEAETKGYVTTMLGRRRAVPQVKATNPQVRALGERLAINSVIQGTAADLMKLAMVNVYKRIEREKSPARILLQIHDELVVEAPEAVANDAAQLVREEMQNAMALCIPLKVDAGVGPNWFEVK